MARGVLGVTRDGKTRWVKPPAPGSLDFAFRSVRGGKRYVMEVLAPWAMHFEPRLEPAVVRWAQLTPWQRRFVTLDDLAACAGLTPGEFLGAVLRASFEFTGNIADWIIACAYPKVIQASVKRALTPEGIEDRLVLIRYMEEWADRQAAAATQPREETLTDKTREETLTDKIAAVTNSAQGTESTDTASPSSNGQPPPSGRPPVGSIH